MSVDWFSFQILENRSVSLANVSVGFDFTAVLEVDALKKM